MKNKCFGKQCFWGFLVVKNLLGTNEVGALNEAIDANQDKRGQHVGAADSTPTSRGLAAPVFLPAIPAFTPFT